MQAAQRAQAGGVHTRGQPMGASWLPVLAQLHHSAAHASWGRSKLAGWCEWVSGWQGLQPGADKACWPGRSLVLHAGLWAVLWVMDDIWVRGRRRGRAGQS